MSSAPAYDVAVVGGGVVGCAVARLLSRHELRVVLLERGGDVGAGTSKANTAILHTGFDATPGSLEATLVRRGYELLGEYAASAGISVEHTGAVLVAWTDEQAEALPALHAKAAANGYHECEIIDAASVRALEPNLAGGVRAGMTVPGEHLIDPWSTPVAFAYEAVANGCDVLTNRHVTKCVVGPETTGLHCADGSAIDARFVVNAAGLHGDELHRAMGFDGFTVRPRRGELIVFDKLARPLIGRTILPVPTAHTKGVLVAPTVFGNVMVGPTADDIDDKGGTATTRAGLDGLLAKAGAILPALLHEEVTATYAGLRAATDQSDYRIVTDASARYVCLGGIRSTGLTASMALAEHALSQLGSIGLQAAVADSPVAVRVTPLGEIDRRPYQDGASPIVCHCERVTQGEITAACSAPVPAVDLDGLRRRTRTLAGRCQGFYCLAAVTELTGWPVDR
jgi:glycerol-3-phosphate dehydrogenase